MTAITCQQIPGALIALIRQSERPDVATIESLLFDMTGNHFAAMMLRHLLRWWPKSESGWVYKSHVDWWNELRIKQSDLPTANGALTNIGVEIELRKAEGAPTKHYHLNLKRFWEAVRRTLKLSAKKFATFLKNAIEGTHKMDLANGAKTITTNPSTKPPTDTNAVLLDTSIESAKSVQGISDTTARGLVAKYGPYKVMAAVKLTHSRKRNNPAGTLVACLRDQWECPPLEPQSLTTFQEKDDGEKFRDDTPHTPLPPSPQAGMPPGFPPTALPPDEDTEPDGVVADDTTDRDVDVTPAPEIATPESQAWNTAYQQLEIQLDRASFDTWLRGAEFLRVETKTYVIGVPNKYACDMLQHRLYRDIRRVLSDVIGVETEMQFEVHKVVKEEPDELPLFKRLAMEMRK